MCVWRTGLVRNSRFPSCWEVVGEIQNGNINLNEITTSLLASDKQTEVKGELFLYKQILRLRRCSLLSQQTIKRDSRLLYFSNQTLRRSAKSTFNFFWSTVLVVVRITAITLMYLSLMSLWLDDNKKTTTITRRFRVFREPAHNSRGPIGKLKKWAKPVVQTGYINDAIFILQFVSLP